jgi:hypothetical protein
MKAITVLMLALVVAGTVVVPRPAVDAPKACGGSCN